MKDLMKEFINKFDERFDTHSTIIRNLETQVGKIANLLDDRAPGTPPSDIEKNLKESIKAMSLRSEKTSIDPVVKTRPVVVSKQT